MYQNITQYTHTQSILSNPMDLFNAPLSQSFNALRCLTNGQGSVPLSKSLPLSRIGRLIIIDGQLQKQWNVVCVCMCVCKCVCVCLVQIYLYLEHVRGTCNANEAHFNLDLWPEIGTVHCLSNLSLSFSLSICLSFSLSLSSSVYLSISFPFSLCFFYFIFFVPYEMRQGTEQQDWTWKSH